MIGFVMVIHAMICILLATIILMQSGRGGGLTEGFASAESMFGAKTNVFLIKTTTVLVVFFITTCLTLAFFSAKKERSLMSDRPRHNATLPMTRQPADQKDSQAQAPVDNATVNPIKETKETGEDVKKDESQANPQPATSENPSNPQ